MSAEIVWNAIAKNAAYTMKRAGVVFSHRSVDNLHRQNSSQFGRRRAVDVTHNGKLIKIEDGKTSIHRYNAKRGKKLLENFRVGALNKVTRKHRLAVRAASKKASSFTAKKVKA
eukprot:UN01257